MKLSSLLFVSIVSALFSLNLSASEQPDHFKGLVPKDINEAVANFSEYNVKLAAIIKQNKLSQEDMHTVHELTYTLENALGKLSAVLGTLAETLEAVHLASEQADPETVQEQGARYIETAKKIIQ